MDVEKVFGLLRNFFDQEREPLVVVGGLAMLTYGATRNTYDCDLLVRSAVRSKVIAFLESAGYRTASDTAGFSNHLHHDSDFGRLDIVYVDDETARQVFGARRQAQLGANVNVSVPSPNHLIAMKAQALRTDPERRSDVEDLQLLLARDDVDQVEAATQFEANGLADLHRGIVDRLRHL